jgi:hypothetical protein
LHIHTESVVAAQDGPTKLYLDKLSVKQNVSKKIQFLVVPFYGNTFNSLSSSASPSLSLFFLFGATSIHVQFWGSSILSSQQDAIKSGKALNDGQVFSADVQGIRLSTLVKNTMLPFRTQKDGIDNNHNDNKNDSKNGGGGGGLLIIKMDVEGAEYQVLKEVAASGVLCDYIRLGNNNRVYFIVEYHNRSITNPKERKREKDGHQAARTKLEECGVEFGKLQASWH